MPLTAHYAGGLTANTNRNPSMSIWGDCPIQEIEQGSVQGWHFFDDFVNFLFTVPTTEANAGLYKGFSSTGGLMDEGDEIGGSVAFGSDGDNEGASIASRQLPFQVSASCGDFWFECRVKSSTIADTKHGIFVGLIDSCTLSATVPIAAAGTLADENFVGFHRLEGDGDQFDTVYKADGVTQVTVKADAVTIAADTYVKLGMRYSARDSKLYFFADGVRLPDSKTIPSNTGTDFPADVRMGLIFAVLNATASTPGTAEIDWWKAAQLAV